jgi:hypothetical protein
MPSGKSPPSMNSLDSGSYLNLFRDPLGVSMMVLQMPVFTLSLWGR